MIHTEMKRIQRLALAMLLVLGTGSVHGAGADGADIQFNCPCTFTSTDGSSGSFSVGIRNIAASATPALSFEIWLHTSNVVGEDASFLASGNIGSIGAATTTSPQPISVNLEGPASGSYFATVDLLSDGEIVDQLRLADEIPMGAGFSTTDIDLLQDTDGDGVAD